MSTENTEFEPRIAAFLCNWVLLRGGGSGGREPAAIPEQLQGYPQSLHRTHEPQVHSAGLQKGYRPGFGSPADTRAIATILLATCSQDGGSLSSKNLLEYIGLEPGRLHFSWISSAEAEKFQRTSNEVIEAVRKLGPAGRLNKDIRRVA